MNINPSKLASYIFNSATTLEKRRIKNNINDFGDAIFKKLNFTTEQAEEFKQEFLKLANKRGI